MSKKIIIHSICIGLIILSSCTSTVFIPVTEIPQNKGLLYIYNSFEKGRNVKPPIEGTVTYNKTQNSILKCRIIINHNGTNRIYQINNAEYYPIILDSGTYKLYILMYIEYMGQWLNTGRQVLQTKTFIKKINLNINDKETKYLRCDYIDDQNFVYELEKADRAFLANTYKGKDIATIITKDEPGRLTLYPNEYIPILDKVERIKLSPDNKYAAVRGFKYLKLYNLVNKKEINQLKIQDLVKYSTFDIEFTPDNKYVILTEGLNIFKWNTVTGEKTNLFFFNENSNSKHKKVSELSTSSDGQFLLASNEDTIRLYNLVDNKEVDLGYKGESITSLISPDGKYALISDRPKATMRLWDIAKKNEIRSFSDDDSHIFWAFACSADFKYALTGGSDGRVVLWELSSGKKIKVLNSEERINVKSVVFSPDGKYAMVGLWDFKIPKVWDLSTYTEVEFPYGDSTWAEKFQRCGSGFVSTVDFSHDGKYALFGTSSSLQDNTNISYGMYIME